MTTGVREELAVECFPLDGVGGGEDKSPLVVPVMGEGLSTQSRGIIVTEEALPPLRTLPATQEPGLLTTGVVEELAVECSPLEWAGGEEDAEPLITRVGDGRLALGVDTVL